MVPSDFLFALPTADSLPTLLHHVPLLLVVHGCVLTAHLPFMLRSHATLADGPRCEGNRFVERNKRTKGRERQKTTHRRDCMVSSLIAVRVLSLPASLRTSSQHLPKNNSKLRASTNFLRLRRAYCLHREQRNSRLVVALLT